MKASKPVEEHASKRPPKISREDLPEAIQPLLKAKAPTPVEEHASKRRSKTSREDLPEALQALLKAKEAARFLNVSENTIRMWIWQRRLPVVRLGRAVRIYRRDLEDLIERNREEAITL